MKFRKKPVVIEAIQFTGGDESVNRMFDAWGPKFQRQMSDIQENGILKINALEGILSAQTGDWIIRGIKGEFYPCKPDIFEATYERVEE